MSGGSNSSGSARVTIARQMADFDKLPPTARAALASAAFDWATPSFYRNWSNGRRGYKTGNDIAQRIAVFDRNAHIEDANAGRVAPTQQGGRIW